MSRSRARPNQTADDPVIVAARRTPIGRRNGALKDLHPHRLLQLAQDSAIAAAGVAPGAIDAVVTGCVTQIGEQSYNIGRMALLASGLPDTVPAMTIDAQCGSGQQAVNVAAALIRSGAAEVVLASGVEAMSRIPLGTAQQAGPGTPYSAGYLERYEVVTQGESAERIADRWQIGRAACDEWAARSQDRALSATQAGRFAPEIVAVPEAGLMNRDEGIRTSTPQALAALPAAFRPDGRHTAGNSSQISDGAAAVVVTTRRRAEQLGVSPLAQIAGQAFVGVDPVLKLTGAVTATSALLARSGRQVPDIDLFEVSEAFAAVVIAWLAELKADPEVVNVNGGAIALGHPVGASGVRLITTAAHEMGRRGADSAVVAMCCGGGLGTATLLTPA
jgi:acetyl-CoA acetyltransferase family protein